MQEKVEKQSPAKVEAMASATSQQETKETGSFEFTDNRAEALVQRKQKAMISGSAQLKKASFYQNLAHQYVQQQAIQLKVNNTGLPNQLKTGVESLSGIALDDVKVHYNSAKPAQLQAHAYAQGKDIHLGPGQEKHLPHETWHVVQQKQGRVKPTTQLKTGVNINDDAALEREADVMGAKALTTKPAVDSNSVQKVSVSSNAPVQAKLNPDKAKEFKAWVAENLPTLPDEIVESLINKSSATGLFTAIREAKKIAIEIEGKAIAARDGSSSVSIASRSLAAELFDAYPIASHHYILLGNSPAILRNALKEAHANFSDLPLGGLTDPEAQREAFGGREDQIGTFGKEVLGNEREVYSAEFGRNHKLQTYLLTFLERIKEHNLVVIDYTQTGGSAVIAADLLKLAAGAHKTIKLFTFSHKLPDHTSHLTQQKDYDLTAVAPLGAHERTFVNLTDGKAYKKRLGLNANKSLTIGALNGMEDPRYESVLAATSDPEGQHNIDRL